MSDMDRSVRDNNGRSRGDGLLDQLVGAILPDLREAVRAAVREAVAESNDLGRSRRLYTIDEVAEVLKVSHSTVRRLIDSGHLKSVRIGGQIRIRQKDLDDYVASSADAG
jgi:excisionase family DNA binding protein